MSDRNDGSDGRDLAWTGPGGGFTTSIPWTDYAGHRWAISVRLETVGGRLHPVELTVHPLGKPAGRWVSGSLLRQLPVARIVEQARGKVPHAVAGVAQVKSTRRTGPARVQVTEARGPGRPRARDNDAFFARVAREHREATLITSAPTQALARKYGVSRVAVQKWLRTCRELDLLPPA